LAAGASLSQVEEDLTRSGASDKDVALIVKLVKAFHGVEGSTC
jgi:hypothetical protein